MPYLPTLLLLFVSLVTQCGPSSEPPQLPKKDGADLNNVIDNANNQNQKATSESNQTKTDSSTDTAQNNDQTSTTNNQEKTPPDLFEPEPEQPQDPQPNNPPPPTNNDQPKLNYRPILLVGGWGENYQENMAKYGVFLSGDGFPQEHIHFIGYDFDNNVDNVKNELVPKIKAVIGSYPADTTFDVISHSLGHFLALYALAQGESFSKVKKFVGVAGAAHGSNNRLCPRRQCNDADELLEFNSNFINTFFTTYKDQVAKLEKCSLYSDDDDNVNPTNSGAFEDGKNLEMPDMGHMQAITQQQFYVQMRDFCYQDGFKITSP